MKTSPFHSKLLNPPLVHHDETTCKVGDNIQPENKVSGTGGRPK